MCYKDCPEINDNSSLYVTYLQWVQTYFMLTIKIQGEYIDKIVIITYQTYNVLS